jgi:hypothetical protein
MSENNAPDGTDKDFTVTYAPDQAIDKGPDPKNPTDTFQFHPNAASVISPHGFSYAIIHDEQHYRDCRFPRT